MPVTRLGPYCIREGCHRPAQVGSGLCAKCAHLVRAFRSVAADLDEAPDAWAKLHGDRVGEPLTELEVELTLSVSRKRFDSEVWAWINKEAA